MRKRGFHARSGVGIYIAWMLPLGPAINLAYTIRLVFPTPPTHCTAWRAVWIGVYKDLADESVCALDIKELSAHRTVGPGYEWPKPVLSALYS